MVKAGVDPPTSRTHWCLGLIGDQPLVGHRQVVKDTALVSSDAASARSPPDSIRPDRLGAGLGSPASIRAGKPGVDKRDRTSVDHDEQLVVTVGPAVYDSSSLVDSSSRSLVDSSSRSLVDSSSRSLVDSSSRSLVDSSSRSLADSSSRSLGPAELGWVLDRVPGARPAEHVKLIDECAARREVDSLHRLHY
jgi:hypothetical protein